MQGPSENRLLNALPEPEYDRLAGALERIEAPHGSLLFEPDETLEYVYFPIDAAISLTMQTADGDVIEITMIGPEGVVGSWLALGGPTIAPWSGVVQAPGTVWRCPVSAFRGALHDSPVLGDLVLRLALGQTYLISRSVACNRFHDLSQRTARWLLIMSTKTPEVPLPLTHEFLSQMLGVYRPSVTTALQTLAEAGLIRNEGRGRVRILDAAGLQDAACECFAQVQQFNRRVLGELA